MKKTQKPGGAPTAAQSYQFEQQTPEQQTQPSPQQPQQPQPQRYPQQTAFTRPNEPQRTVSQTKAETLKNGQQLHQHRSPTSSLSHRSPNTNSQRAAVFEGSYPPVRTPSNPQRLTKTRSSSSNNGIKSLHPQYASQEKSYLRKMRNDAVDDYYTKAVIADSSDSEQSAGDEDQEDEEYHNWNEFEYNEGFFKETNLEIDAHHAFDPSVIEHTEDNPKFLERLEWQTMLSLVLNGDVISSEKKRINTQNDVSLQTTYKENLWLGIKAYILHRSDEQQKKIIEYSRSFADDVFNDILNFKIVNPEKALEEVKEVLNRYDNVKELWRHQQEMAHDKPICGTDEFITKVEALISWKNITKALSRELESLAEWTQSDNLDLSIPRSDGFTDDSFADRLLKEGDVRGVFRKRIFKPFIPWLNKSKSAYLTFHEVFNSMDLPSFIPDLSNLEGFPLRLIQEILKVRLAYARKLDNPTMMMIDEMIDDFSSYIELAVEIKHCHNEFAKAWSIDLMIIEGFDKTVLEAIKYLFMLINKKLINTASRSFKSFKEPDELEQVWLLLKNVGCYIDGAGPEVATQIISLMTRLISRLITFVTEQPKNIDRVAQNTSLTESQKENDISSMVSSSVDTFSTVRRKLAKFSGALKRALSNSALFSITKVKPFLDQLRDSSHFLVKTNFTGGVYILVSRDLYGRDEDVLRILNANEIGSDTNKPRPSLVDLDEYDEETEQGYVVIINAAKAMLWDGLVVTLDYIPESYYDIKPGEVLLIAQGAASNLRQAKAEFIDIVGDNVSYIEQRSSLPKVYRDMIRCERLFYKLILVVFSELTLGKAAIQTVNKHHDGINQLYCFARDLGKNYLKGSDTARRAVIIKKMIVLSIDWVSYIVDDCVPTDKKTFRWCVSALEFAMELSQGFNILTLKDEQFTQLKEKVAGCMSLLISHFDIMGARSTEAESKLLPAVLQPKTLQNDAKLLEAFSRKTMQGIEDLEVRTTGKAIGKVLDDTQTENQFLSFLASSFSSLSIRWQKRKFIGGGSFGSVFSALNLDSGAVLAVKEIRFQDTQSIKQIVPTIKDEMTVLEMLNHPNIAQYYGVEVHRDRVNIFMEFCEGGSLANLLEHGRIEDELVIQVYALQMFEGLAYLHEMGIVHRDVKPENVLLDHNGIIKFVDFGAAKVAKNLTRKPATRANSMTGTPMYMSPEVITGSNSSRFGAPDIWSTGCCVLEMVTGRRPWANLDNEWAIMYHIAAGHLPQFPSKDQLSEMGFNFLRQCFQTDPNKRASASELLQDPWMLDIRAKAFSDSASSTSEVSSDYGG